MTARRWMSCTVVGVLLVATMAGCGSAQADQRPPLWHGGTLTIGTGPTNGTFNQLGGGYADVINRHLPGYEALAPPTNGAGDNLKRIARGDIEVALTFADVAADAVQGKGTFAAEPVRLRALARIYNSYTQLVVRVKAGGSTSVAGLRGHRVGTGPAGSGTEEVASRLMTAAGLDPAKDVTRVPASLNQMVSSMKDGTLDAMFYASGLPTTGITALLSQLPGKFMIVPTQSVLAELDKTYPGVYIRANIPRETYGLPADVATIAIPNLVVVDAAMPDDLAYQLTRMLFEYQTELAAVHPEGRNIARTMGPKTAPVPLHPGAERYYNLS